MKPLRREIQIFSLSFLDVITCALGGVLLLLILQRSEASRWIDYFSDQVDLTRRILDARGTDLARAYRARGEAAADAAWARDQVSRIRREQSSLVGFRGRMSNVVFVFDTSESMNAKGEDRWRDYRGMLSTWIERLLFERFNVIDFDNRVQVWSTDGLADATPDRRAAALAWVGETARPDGQTNTLLALQTAFAMEGVDTVILVSDGEPTHPHTAPTMTAALAKRNIDETLAWVREQTAARPEAERVVVNTVAVGNYLKQDYGTFLQQIAEATGGEFLGRN